MESRVWTRVPLAQGNTNDIVAFYPRNSTESSYIRRKSTQHDEKKYGKWKTIKSSKFNDSRGLIEYTQKHEYTDFIPSRFNGFYSMKFDFSCLSLRRIEMNQKE